jgi:hypothetical protein
MNRQRRNKQNFKSIPPKTHLKYHTLVKEKIYIYIVGGIFSRYNGTTSNLTTR